MASRASPRPGTVWLVCNAASGSNDEAALAELRESFAAAGMPLAREICFPQEDAPHRDRLAEEDVDMLAVFAGDGTTHAVVTGAYGWDGAVLVLPGGTMNLLARRLHGEVATPAIVAQVGRGTWRRDRPTIVRTRHGDGLSGALAGPGAVWNEVREALREADVVELVASARQAIAQSTSRPGVVCRGVDCDRADGYAAITVNPTQTGLEANGYYAESLGDLAGHSLALLGRNFRDGPHDPLGRFGAVTIATQDGAPMELLLDGEPFEGGAEERFDLVRCDVDLVATRASGDSSAYFEGE